MSVSDPMLFQDGHRYVRVYPIQPAEVSRSGVVTYETLHEINIPAESLIRIVFDGTSGTLFLEAEEVR